MKRFQPSWLTGMDVALNQLWDLGVRHSAEHAGHQSAQHPDACSILGRQSRDRGLLKESMASSPKTMLS